MDKDSRDAEDTVENVWPPAPLHPSPEQVPEQRRYRLGYPYIAAILFNIFARVALKVQFPGISHAPHGVGLTPMGGPLWDNLVSGALFVSLLYCLGFVVVTTVKRHDRLGETLVACVGSGVLIIVGWFIYFIEQDDATDP
jgi:hypothetical protein